MANIIGIVAEYNPFHNGHLYQIDKIKEIFPDSTIIVVSSGSFSQRGDISVLTKYEKTCIALNHNVDLFLELPYVYATQSADIFAHYSLQILNNFNIDYLVFGTETDNIDHLIKSAQIELNNKDFDEKVKLYLDSGINYPTALNNALKDLNGYEINTPNDLLALSYIKEIIKNNYKFKPYNIKRTSSYHDKESNEEIISATNIREKLHNNINISSHVPNDVYEILKENKNNNKYFEYLKYKIISEEELSKYLDVDEGLSSRIKEAINTSNNLEELIQNIKIKRYTYNKINRMLSHILTSLTKEEVLNTKELEYIRVLGFNNKGKDYLNQIKKDIKIQILNSYDYKKYKALNIEKRISTIYSMIKKDILKEEYSNKPIIKE